MSHVFISYSRRNSKYADALVSELENNGFSVWIDRDRIHYGSKWEREIKENIRTCAALIVIMSPAAEDSEWVGNEVIYAKDENKPVFPILLEGENWLRFRTTQIIDARDGNLPPERFYEHLSDVAPRNKSSPPAEADVVETKIAPPSNEIVQSDTSSPPADASVAKTKTPARKPKSSPREPKAASPPVENPAPPSKLPTAPVEVAAHHQPVVETIPVSPQPIAYSSNSPPASSGMSDSFNAKLGTISGQLSENREKLSKWWLSVVTSEKLEGWLGNLDGWWSKNGEFVIEGAGVGAVIGGIIGAFIGLIGWNALGLAIVGTVIGVVAGGLIGYLIYALTTGIKWLGGVIVGAMRGLLIGGFFGVFVGAAIWQFYAPTGLPSLVFGSIGGVVIGALTGWVLFMFVSSDDYRTKSDDTAREDLSIGCGMLVGLIGLLLGVSIAGWIGGTVGEVIGRTLIGGLVGALIFALIGTLIRYAWERFNLKQLFY